MVDVRSFRQAGPDLLVIAEAGVNHNGRVELAHRLIDVAATSGAQVVKFQTFTPAKLIAPDTAATPYQKQQGATDQSELLRSLALPSSAWSELCAHASEAGIGFLSTPFDIDSAVLLRDIGVDALKVPSGELTNLPYIRALADMGLPLLISTGMGERTEVREALDAASAAPYVALFHCVSAYPAPLQDCNLAAIPRMAQEFDCVVGWSDHTIGTDSSIMAAALGTRLFEKHFTLDKKMAGPDHQASLEPDELLDYVASLKGALTLLGDGLKRRMPSEQENAPLVRRSWHSTRDLEAGHVLTEADFVALRPEAGILPSQNIEGRTLSRSIRTAEPFEKVHFGLE